MRIIHITNHLRKSGNGTTNVVVDLACMQAKLGHSILTISSEGEYQNLLKSYGVEFINLGKISWKHNPLELIKIVFHYYQLVKRFKPDIVHAHQPAGLMIARFLQYGLKYNLVSTVHRNFGKGIEWMGWADRVIAVSNSIAKFMAVDYHIPLEKLKVVTNGTLGSPRSYQLEQYIPVELMRPSITTVAGLYWRKGIAELITAFVKISQDFPEVHLYIVGQGPERIKFETMARQTSAADKIHFEGFQSEPQRYLLSTDIFVLASHQDPCPLVISEAREAGCAIVASNVDGIPEALDCGQAGILIPPSDSSALGFALAELLGNNDVLLNWKTRAQQNLDRFKVIRVTNEVLDIYRELISNNQQKIIKSS